MCDILAQLLLTYSLLEIGVAHNESHDVDISELALKKRAEDVSC